MDQKIADFKKELCTSLIENRSGDNRKKLAKYILDHNIPLVELKDLILAERTLAMRFSWLLGDICAINSAAINEILTFLFKQRDQVNFQNFDRSLAKFFWVIGIPEEIEGEGIDELFKWLFDQKINVATKVYSISALLEVTKKYPDLKNELYLAIEDQIDKTSIAFRVRARQVLLKLKDL